MSLSLGCLALLTILVYRLIFSRLSQLSEHMDSVNSQQLTASEELSGGDEIDHLNRHFRQMLKRIDAANTTEKELIFNDLTNDLKPHFICNAMDMLRLQAERAEQPALAASVVQIGQYFRYSMLGEQNGVTLISELEDVRSYIELVNAMREKKILLDIELSEWAERNAAKLIVPKMP